MYEGGARRFPVRGDCGGAVRAGRRAWRAQPDVARSSGMSASLSRAMGVAWREAAARPSVTLLRFEGFDQEEDLGGHRVVELRGLGQGTVSAAGDDGLEGVGEASEASGLKSGSALLKKGRGGGRIAGEQRPGDGEGEATLGEVALAAVAAVREVAGDGLALRLRSGRGVAGGRLDVCENGPGFPRIGRAAESTTRRRPGSRPVSGWARSSRRSATRWPGRRAARCRPPRSERARGFPGNP
jgi:hypothetical protein